MSNTTSVFVYAFYHSDIHKLRNSFSRSDRHLLNNGRQANLSCDDFRKSSNAFYVRLEVPESSFNMIYGSILSLNDKVSSAKFTSDRDLKWCVNFIISLLYLYKREIDVICLKENSSIVLSCLPYTRTMKGLLWNRGTLKQGHPCRKMLYILLVHLFSITTIQAELLFLFILKMTIFWQYYAWPVCAKAEKHS